MQTFNIVQMNGWSCSPKHGPAHFTVLTTFFIGMVWSISKRFELMAGPCSPKHGPVLFTVWKNHFVWILNDRVCGWAALPNIPCHGPVYFAALKNRFALMLCKHSTTFKWKAFQKHSNLWLGRALPNTAQFYSRCWWIFSSGCYAAM